MSKYLDNYRSTLSDTKSKPNKDLQKYYRVTSRPGHKNHWLQSN